MTFKELAQKLSTTIQTVPELFRVLREGFEDMESGTGEEYSTTERKIGKWIDNSELYEKTVFIEHLPDGTISDDWVYYNTGIEGTINVIDMRGTITFANGNKCPIPYVLANSAQGAFLSQIGLFFKTETTQIGIMCGSDRSTASAYVTIKYTKVTT